MITSFKYKRSFILVSYIDILYLERYFFNKMYFLMIPYDKRSGKIWYNDNLVDWGDVKLHVLSHGLHYASCVFEGERVYDGAIFKLEEHTERFFYSAKRMGFSIPFSQDQINEASKNYIYTKSKQWLCKTSRLAWK